MAHRRSLGFAPEPVTFSIFSCFLHSNQLYFKPPNKAVILSGAPHRWIG